MVAMPEGLLHIAPSLSDTMHLSTWRGAAFCARAIRATGSIVPIWKGRKRLPGWGDVLLALGGCAREVAEPQDIVPRCPTRFPGSRGRRQQPGLPWSALYGTHPAPHQPAQHDRPGCTAHDHRDLGLRAQPAR